MKLGNVTVQSDSVPAWLIPVLLAATIALDYLPHLKGETDEPLPVPALECMAICHEQGDRVQKVGPQGCECAEPAP